MDSLLYEHAAAWSARAAEVVVSARGALIEFGKQREETKAKLNALVENAQADPVHADDDLVRHGVAATLIAFDRVVLQLLSYRNFSSYPKAKSAREAFGKRDISWSPQLTDEDKLLDDIGALAEDLTNFRQETCYLSGQQIATSTTTDLPSLLESVRTASTPSMPERADPPFLFVPKEKRKGRLVTALWTLGILFLLASVSQASLLIFGFIGAALYFFASLIITGQVDGEAQDAERDAEANAGSAKDKVLQMNARAQALLQALIAHIEGGLEYSARFAADLCPVMHTIAKGAVQVEPPLSHLIFGNAAVSPFVDHVVRKEEVPSFRDYADDSSDLYLKDLLGPAEPLTRCVSHVPLGECDEIDVVLDAAAGPGTVERSLAASALAASEPGRARFMFVEPGRLAEAYRVFGGLNESAATRLADRLYITHVSEMASAIDALRTFVGRTKEAMTRQADAARRITDGDDGDKRSVFLQRAVVVLDGTQEAHWPEKDKRRLAEAFEEIAALARVGASEGSVLLIRLRRPTSESDNKMPTSAGERHVGICAGPFGYRFANGARAVYPEAESSAAIGAKCDLWVKDAKKADSSLRQKNASIDWSDSEVSDSRYGLEIDIGRHGVDRPARLILGREGAHHAICIGRTGSGKTNLFHVIISNLVRRYSPDELELYLLDFKEGVEFAVYADLALPHCRAVAIDADRGFGLSVLSHLRRELNRRANVFKAAGVGIASLERYEVATGKNMPRIVLLIDEFQVLLQPGERLPGAAPGAAASALEDLVRRGRSFGLHVILGSQTLAGRELTAATLGQLAVRFVLPCSAADAAMMLGEQPISNQLRAPGDAIVWRAGQGEVSDAHLAKIFEADLDDLPKLAAASREHASATGRPVPAPFVFRGSGQNDLSEVMPHLDALKAERGDPGASLFALGAPTAFGERPAGTLRDARARNLLFVHRTDETRAGFFYSAIDSLMMLDPCTQAIICDLDNSLDLSDAPMAKRLAAAFAGRVRLIESMDLDAEADNLVNSISQPVGTARTVFAINGAGRANLSRSPSFAKLVKEGPESRVHVLATCDSVKNLERLMERSLIAEFGMRALGPASASDSQKLLDASDAESLTAEHQYLFLDDASPGRLVRLQVLSPSLQKAEPEMASEPEVIDA